MLTNYERETIIGYNQEQATATIFTYHPAFIKKLDRLCEAFAGFTCTRRGEHDGAAFAEYEIPKQYVGVKTPRRQTEEQKAAFVQRMNKARDEQSAQNQKQAFESPIL